MGLLDDLKFSIRDRPVTDNPKVVEFHGPCIAPEPPNEPREDMLLGELKLSGFKILTDDPEHDRYTLRLYIWSKLYGNIWDAWVQLRPLFERLPGSPQQILEWLDQFEKLIEPPRGPDGTRPF